MSMKQSIVRQFRSPTGILGELAGQIMARRHSNRVRNMQTVKLMELEATSRVLEVGCGPGLALTRCAQIATEGEVVGLDHSPVMIRQARQRVERSGSLRRVTLIQGGIERLRDWPARFDRVFSLNVIQFIDDKSSFVADAMSCLSPGGGLFTTYQPRLANDDRRALDTMVAELTETMRATGFLRVAVHRFEAGGKPVVCVSGLVPA